MPIHVKTPDGNIAEFPDGMSDAQITTVMQREYPPPKPADKPTTLSGVLGQFGRGAYEGIMGAADSVRGVTLPDPGSMLHTAADAADNIGGLMRRAFSNSGPSPVPPPPIPTRAMPISGAFDAGQQGARQTLSAMGVRHVMPTVATTAAQAPGNRAERYARVAGNMAPNALMPIEGVAGLGAQVASKTASVALPTLGSEGAREATQALGGGKNAQNAAAIAGVVLGGLASGGVGVAPRARPVPTPTPASALAAEGVSLTPGQRLGGLGLAIEDKAMSAPLVGDAIRGARTRGIQALNRAAANRALAPIGEVLPRNVSPGNDAIAHVEARLGEAYDRANALVSAVTPDEAFATRLATIREGLKSQPPSVQKSFDRIVNDRVISRLNAGPVDGAALQDMRSQVGAIAADNLAGGGADRTLGRHLKEVDSELGALAGRANPDYLAAKSAADAGWANYVRIRNASSRAATDSGVFTPAQLKMAVRAEDRSVGKGGTARGSAVMYDLADNATKMMGSKIPNSGTADRAAALGLATTVGAAPHVGVPVALALSVAATPYLMMGRRIVAALPPTATRPQLLTAEARLAELAAKDPKVKPLHAQVLRALQTAAPAAALAATANDGSR